MILKIKSFLNNKLTESDLNIPINLNDIYANPTTIYRVVRAVYNNMNRLRYSHYKTQTALAGSKRKIRPQKRLGRARQGCSREIHMRGGGVKFGFSGDKERDLKRRYRSYLKINKKERYNATLGILANKNRLGCLHIFEDLKHFDNIQNTSKLLKEILPILIVYKDKENIRNMANIKDLSYIHVDRLNVYYILKYKNIAFEKNTIQRVLKIETNQNV